MTTIRVHDTRSTRVRVIGVPITDPDIAVLPLVGGETLGVVLDEGTTPGFTLTVENLNRNEGLRTTFGVKRSIYSGPDEGTVEVYNLGPRELGALEATRGRPGDLLDLETYGEVPEFGQPKPPGPQSAVDNGFVVVELEAGYDGSASEIFSTVAASHSTDKSDGKTLRTTFTGIDTFDGVLFGVGAETFNAGTPIFDIVERLRQLMRLGPGNFNAATFAALVGQATLDEPYCINSNAYEHMRNLLGFLATSDGSSLTWFIDGGELWIMSRKGFINDAPPTVLGRAKTRPKRLTSGLIEYKTFLSPTVRPGRLVVLTASGLGLEGVPSVTDVQRSDIPPGTYRADEVTHAGGTSASDDFSTTVLCYPLPQAA